MKRSHDNSVAQPAVDIEQKLKQLSTSPGIYMMKNAEGEIIYIGKAKNLKRRVSSYFQKKDLDTKTRALVRKIADIDITVTSTAIEALLLEDNLIKKHRPRFNIRLKDDKKYPYIAITYSEEYPRVIFTRNLQNKKNRYFGPYTDAKAARNTIQLINRIFRLKTCTRPLPLKDGERPCLNYQIKHCSGVCQMLISKDDYLELVHSCEQFLEGNIEPVMKELNEKMATFANEMKYENAAVIRNIIFDLQKISEKQSVSVSQTYNTDYIGAERFRDETIVLLFEFRKGVLLGKKIHQYENSSYSNRESILRTFILNHYQSHEIPHLVVTSAPVDDGDIIQTFLSDKAKRPVTLRVAKSQEDKSAISLITRNLDTIIAEKMATESMSDKSPYLVKLGRILSLPEVPVHMVCFDISNFQGAHAVASMASFKHGEPDKANYRRFKIKGYDEPNDPAMIHEGVSRYLAHVVNDEWERPDLIVIDGGPTQLTRAIEARDAFELDIPVISIAKQHEELFVDPKGPPFALSHDSQELKIIQRLRDATHDFGVSYHRKLRDGATLQSELEQIKGIGEKKRNALLSHFKDIEKIRVATEEELQAVDGINRQDIDAIREYFVRD